MQPHHSPVVRAERPHRVCQDLLQGQQDLLIEATDKVPMSPVGAACSQRGGGSACPTRFQSQHAKKTAPARAWVGERGPRGAARDLRRRTKSSVCCHPPVASQCTTAHCVGSSQGRGSPPLNTRPPGQNGPHLLPQPPQLCRPHPGLRSRPSGYQKMWLRRRAAPSRRVQWSFRGLMEAARGSRTQ